MFFKYSVIGAVQVIEYWLLPLLKKKRLWPVLHSRYEEKICILPQSP